MNVHSFVSQWNRFELLIATFWLQYCWSSSGDEVDCLVRVTLCSMLFRCYWCILILIIIPTIRCCSLSGPFCGWWAVVLSDRRYPSFRNFHSTISLDVIRMKSYMNSFFDPTCVPVRVTINKLNFFPNKKMSHFVINMLWNCVGLHTSKPYISVMFFYPFLHRSPCFPDVYFAALTWNLIDDTILFSWFKGVFWSH